MLSSAVCVSQGVGGWGKRAQLKVPSLMEQFSSTLALCLLHALSVSSHPELSYSYANLLNAFKSG